MSYDSELATSIFSLGYQFFNPSGSVIYVVIYNNQLSDLVIFMIELFLTQLQYKISIFLQVFL